jgi:hypothetical protein
MRPSGDLQLEVLKGKEPDLSLHVGGGMRRVTYRFEGNAQEAIALVEAQLGAPLEKDPEIAIWERPGENVSVLMGKLALSESEFKDQEKSRRDSKLSGLEWSKKEGYDKWVTIQIDRKPNSFSRLWFGVQNSFRQ